jgi:NACHT domain-containing protein
MTRAEESVFENEVRRIARHRWPPAQFAGAAMVDGRQRDGIFETEDCIHLVEATVSRGKDNAKENIGKLVRLAAHYQKEQSSKAVRAWFVTKHEPTADQREVGKAHKTLVNIVSFPQFQAGIVDASAYLDARSHYPFGSVRDPASGKGEPKLPYIPLDILESKTQRVWSIAEIRTALVEGKRFTLLGDYGAGKSMTLREIYKEIRLAYLQSKTPRFPIFLNLRDHIGQIDPAEALERHGRSIGFPNPSHLVRAWRAGYAVLLLDGFDEISIFAVQGLWKSLKEHRFRSVQLIREFVKGEHTSGVIIAGRAHFFNNDSERASALGLYETGVELTLNEFSDTQIQRYLANSGLPGTVPSWLPSRPLLVGYLAASGILREALTATDSTENVDPAKGWDLLLDKVSEREADIEAGVEGRTVRRILERVATFARVTQNAVGPITQEQIEDAFTQVCGYKPEGKAAILLQRLPGLGPDRETEGTRSFIDVALLDACMAGDVIEFLHAPYGSASEIFHDAEWGLGSLGVSLVANAAQRSGFSSGKINSVIRKAQELGDARGLLSVDLIRAAVELGCPLETEIQISRVQIPALDLSEGMADVSKLSFRDCYITRLEIDSDIDPALLPKFYSCLISEVSGRTSLQDLPKDLLDSECVVERFTEAAETSSAIVALNLPLGTRVLLTILKKLYVQSGSGRKENALHRGLDHHARRLVDPILRMLETQELAIPYKRGGLSMTIWLPNRSKRVRVGQILDSPHTCGDILVQKASELE